jgi:hypothetical protein
MSAVKELAQLVNEMRTAQKEYHRTKSDAAAEQVRLLEKKVDQLVRDTLDQPTLFEV